jgi:hypothetical protein
MEARIKQKFRSRVIYVNGSLVEEKIKKDMFELCTKNYYGGIIV